MTMDFQDQLVVVTGAASGIGFAAVEEFLSRGARCALIDWNGDAAKDAMDRLSARGGIAKAYSLNVADREAAAWVRDYLWTRAETILAGTSEVQRNILAEQMLGLPKG